MDRAGEQVSRQSSARLGAFTSVFIGLHVLSLLFSGQSVEAASDLGLACMKIRAEGLGGVITVDPQGHWAARFSSRQMAWAAAQKDTLHYGLYKGENFTQSIDVQH